MLDVREKVSRNGNVYYSVKVRDCMNVVGWVTIFGDDYTTFAAQVQPGELLRLRVRPPTPPYTSFTLASRRRNDTRPDQQVVDLTEQDGSRPS